MKAGWILILFLPSWFTVYGQFRVLPYLQNPSPDAMTIVWFSDKDSSGKLIYCIKGSEDSLIIESDPVPALTLDYSVWEDTVFFNGNAPDPPYKHRIRLSGLIPATSYEYKVVQENNVFSSRFRTFPDRASPLRFIVYSDCETEPESTGKFTEWKDSESSDYRSYLIDETTGYRNNLSVIKSRDPDLIFIAGDLVESGGEQRDWDEFWRHNTNPYDSLSLAGSIPLMAIPGNHEYFEGPYMDQYNQPGSETAINKFLTYFENAPNESANTSQEGRYYCLTYTVATFIALDDCNNGTNGTIDDTNFMLLGEDDPGGGNAPGFMPGSAQYVWLEQQLKEARANNHFIFILFHHSPYSSGPHGFAAGICDTCDNQSGTPLRKLTPLFMKYGVDAVLSGHDEIWERSEIGGYRELPGGDSVAHTIQYYDVGVGGDGLRLPFENVVNPFQQFVTGVDSPEEIWNNTILESGGRHYGHLEVNIYPGENNAWHALLTPVYVFPEYNETDSAYIGFERRIYDDEILLTKSIKDTSVTIYQNNTDFTFTVYPNPFHSVARIKFYLPKTSSATISVLDMQGRVLKILDGNDGYPGWHEVEWDGSDDFGNRVSDGMYFIKLVSDRMTLVKRIMHLESY
jgi:3',5'-cyclic AMP phosphodiesterase CpdA